MKTSATALLTVLTLTGCARLHDVGMGMISSPASAHALVHGELLSGTMVLSTDRSGALDLASEGDPALRCMGKLRYTATQSGVIHLQCGDGTQAVLSFNALSETRGFGSAVSARGPIHLVYGMEPEQAGAYLPLPPGKRIPPTPSSPRPEPQ